LKRSVLPPYWAKFLFRLVAERNPQGIVELGTSLGLTTLHLALGSPAAEVVTFEGCENIATLAKKHFRQVKEQPFFNPDKIRLEVGNIDQTLPLFLEKNKKSESPLPLDFVLIDANHTEEATLRYFELLLPHLHAESWVVLDDIYWSKGMQRAWTQIRQHPRVSLQVDLFKMGLLFFSPRLSREHFKLRTFL
jgi:predicted O-methyltransferase YrrM